MTIEERPGGRELQDRGQGKEPLMSTELKIARVLLIVAGIGWVILVILQVFRGD